MHFIWYENWSIFPQFRSFIRKFKKGIVSMMRSKWRHRQSFQNRRTNNPNWASSGSHYIWLSLHIMTSLWDYVNIGLLCPPHSNFFLLITSQVGRHIREPHLFDNMLSFSVIHIWISLSDCLKCCIMLIYRASILVKYKHSIKIGSICILSNWVGQLWTDICGIFWSCSLLP